MKYSRAKAVSSLGVPNATVSAKIFIAENYEVFLSKEIMNTKTLKDLLEINKKNPNASIGELIELYKQPVSEN